MQLQRSQRKIWTQWQTAAKKARIEIPEFQKKGTKNQYNHNNDVLTEVDAAIAALDKDDVDAARERLKEGKKIIQKRLKAIRIADREELGWAVVRHYESDALASDTDDEKDLSRARRAARAETQREKQKLKAKAARRGNLLKKSYTNRYPYRGSQGTVSSPVGRSDATRDIKPLTCWGCGKDGHSQRFCYARSRR